MTALDLDALRARRAELKKELRELTQLIALGTRYATRGETSRPSVVADAVHALLCAAGEPMQRGDIVRALEAQGVRLPSVDKARYVGTIIWRDKRVISAGQQGYVVKEPPS